MKKIKLKPIVKIFICLIVIIAISTCAFIFAYKTNLKPVDKNSKDVIKFEVKQGDGGIAVLKRLEEKGLIRSEFLGKIYLRGHNFEPKVGTYKLKKSYSLEKIFNVLESGKPSKWITFVEGKRLTYFAEEISKKFGYSYDEVMNTLDDKEYIKSLIPRYYFLTDEILTDGIYHPLEGYLYADTYNFDADESLKSIIEHILDNTGKKWQQFDFSKSSLSVHKIVTLASIIELEGSASSDRNGIAGVFYNRLNKGMSLGSDVTTYYAAKKDFSEDLLLSELNDCNAYNTRSACLNTLPIGPISSPSIKSVEAALNPTSSDNLFFVADKNGKTYFSKTNEEHMKIVNDLKAQGLWYVYN